MSNLSHREEPKTLADMQARKKAADDRQAAAARHLADRGTPRPAPIAVSMSEPPPEQTPTEPKEWTADPDAEVKILAMLGDTIERNPRRIIARVAEAHGLLPADILGEGRSVDLVIARREAMGAVRLAFPRQSLPWIGRQFGRDHTTVLHHLREIGLAAPAAEIAALAVNEPDQDGLRRVQALSLADLVPAAVHGRLPEFRWVDPATLFVDPSYQRNLSEQSLGLIRRIVEGWSWAAFKTPIVVERGGDLHVIDGQHTAMGAAPHGGIPRIPVMMVLAETRQDRARAFVQHNRDRVAMSAPQIHFGLVAAGDPTARTIDAVCREAGAAVLRSKPAGRAYKVGQTMAIVALKKLVIRRGHEGARLVVRTCVQAELAPISADAIRAVEALLFDPDHAGQFDGEALALCLRSLGSKADREAGVFAAQHRVPVWRGLAITLARAAQKLPRKSRGGAS